jgi:hypothetical protein
MSETIFVIINTAFQNGNPYFSQSALSHVLQHVFFQ